MSRSSFGVRHILAIVGTSLLLFPWATLPKDQNESYDDSGSGLKHLLQDALKAAKDRNQERLQQITTDMLLPKPEEWFTRVFGAEAGAAYGQHYRSGMPSLASQLGSALEDWESQKFTDVDVTRFTGACDRQAGEDEYPILAARETPEPLSRAAFRHDAFEHELRFFAYVDGKFRYVGGLKPPESFDRKDGSAETDTSLASAMKVPGAIHSARLIKGDPPTYPTEANIQRFEGDVVLHAIITADGRVAELRVMKGRCMFAEAAVNAVRKWRYSPTMVAGKPVAVDTTIDVRFALSR